MTKIKNVFDLAHRFQSVFYILDFPTKNFEKFITTKYTIIRFIVYQLFFFMYLIYFANINFQHLRSKSHILNLGFNLCISLGISSLITLKTVVYWKRKNIWLVLKKFDSIDVIVSILNFT